MIATDKTNWQNHCCSHLMLAIAIGLACGCDQSNQNNTKVNVFAASSLEEVINQASHEFSQRDGAMTVTSFAGTATLANQIMQGAKVDIFVSANRAWVTELEKRRLVFESCELLGNELVVISREGNTAATVVRSLRDLKGSSMIRRIAIADPDSVPAGIYARQAFEESNIWPAIKSKCVYGVSVRQTLAHVESGAADVGVVYRTDAKLSTSVQELFAIPEELSGEIRYQLVLIDRDKSMNPRAKRLYDFLSSQDCEQLFQQHGFLIAEGNCE